MLTALISAALMAAPPRVSYDAHSFKIDGKNTFIYSGAFHYFRCPEALWPERFQKIKEAGFNTVETYVAWNDSEPNPPKNENDFSKINLKQVDHFLDMAIHHYGLNVVIRPGPYICSEWDMGGYPAWLMAKKPKNPTRHPWLRSDDPTYLSWCRHWYRAVDKVIGKYQITKARPGGKGVILYQIENEYDYAGGSDQVHLNQLHVLADQARKDGIDVPLITCWTHQIRTTTDPLLKSIVDCPNFYPRWDVEGTKGSIDAAHNQQPGKPVMITELQGGWFSEVGGLLAEDQVGITAAQERNLTLYCIQNGVTATSYYMLFGGTNFGDRTPPNITTSYDYFAPIREDGEGGDKFQEVKALGALLAKYGEAIATSSLQNERTTSGQKEVQVAIRKATDGTRFVFLRNNSHTEAFSGTASVGDDSFTYTLNRFGSFVIVVPPGKHISDGEWLPKTDPAPNVRGKTTAVHITEAWTRTDDGTSNNVPAKLGDVALNGIYDNRYVLYRAQLPAVKLNEKLLLGLSGSGEGVVRIDGQTLKPEGRRHGQPVYDLPATAQKGDTVEVLYENPGRPNGGEGMEEDHGLVASKLMTMALSDRIMTTWKIRNTDLNSARQFVVPGIDDSKWDTVQVQSGQRQSQLDGYGTVAVFRTNIDLTQHDIDSSLTHLACDGIDDEGWVFVNGELVGENHEWNVPVEADVKKRLHPGTNVVAIICRNFGGQGGLYEVPTLTGGSDEGDSLSWTLSEMSGVAGDWAHVGSLDGWQRTILASHPLARKIRSGTAIPQAGDRPTKSLSRWFRMSFDKPNSNRPLGLRVDALGNGFLWLNGHALGRYWQVGPQREYFLPSNWLKAHANDLRFQLRAVDGYATIRAAEVTHWGD